MLARCELIVLALLITLLQGCDGTERSHYLHPELVEAQPQYPIPLVNAGRSTAPLQRSLELPTDFVARQDALREALLEHLPLHQEESREIPFRVVNTNIDESTGLTRSTLVFRSFDDAEIPAVLQFSANTPPRPAVLLIPGHVPGDRSGLNQLVFEPDSYQKAAATELAHAGFVTLAFELRGFGLLGKSVDTSHLHVAYNAIANGTSYKSVVVRDAQAAFDLLRSLPETDGSNVAVAGASYGGEVAVALAALDRRVAAVAFSSYGGRVGSFRPALGRNNRQQHYCHVIPGTAGWLEQQDIFLLVAPRPMRGFRGGEDARIDHRFSELLKEAWSLRSTDTTTSPELAVIEGRGHDFFVAETISFLSDVLPWPAD